MALANRHVRLTRETGALAVLPQTLAQLIGIHMRQGELAAATALMREVDAAVDATRCEPLAPTSRWCWPHTAGNEAEGQRLIETARTQLTPESRGIGVIVVEFANSALRTTASADIQDGLRSGRRVLEDLEPVGRPPWALPEVVEAAARTGAIEEATPRCAISAREPASLAPTGHRVSRRARARC